LGRKENVARYELFWITGTIATSLHDVDFTAYWIEAISVFVVLLKMVGCHCQRRGSRAGAILIKGEQLTGSMAI
jgi:hypothetical protein